MMSKRFKKHISELSNRQFRRRITSETEKVMRCIFENIKDNDDYDDRDEETRKGIIFAILFYCKIICIMYETIYFILWKCYFKKKIILKLFVLTSN